MKPYPEFLGGYQGIMNILYMGDLVRYLDRQGILYDLEDWNVDSIERVLCRPLYAMNFFREFCFESIHDRTTVEVP